MKLFSLNKPFLFCSRSVDSIGFNYPYENQPSVGVFFFSGGDGVPGQVQALPAKNYRGKNGVSAISDL